LTWGLDHDLRAGDQFGRVEPFPEVPNVKIHLNSKAIVENALFVSLSILHARSWAYHDWRARCK
jgi:hypothetical protein